jgi:hypothetical protein
MKQFIIYPITVLLTFVSCQKILFDDDVRTNEIILEDFNAVEFYGIYNIVLVQDSTNRLVITGSNDIYSVDAFIENDTLIIDNHKKVSFNAEKNRLVLHFTNLDHIATHDPVNISNRDTINADRFVYHGVGEITEADLTINCIQLIVSNSANTLGDFYFRGKVSYCLLWNRYGSGMFADGLTCKDADIYTESIGPVNINASGHIRAFIRGPGNIYYYGNPVIDIEEKTGEGEIIKIN